MSGTRLERAHCARGFRIRAHGEVALVLGLVDGGAGRRIDDEFRRKAVERFAGRESRGLPRSHRAAAALLQPAR
jgi:hypothetical protein